MKSTICMFSFALISYGVVGDFGKRWVLLYVGLMLLAAYLDISGTWK